MMEEVGSEKKAGREAQIQKSYFDVLGLCCSAEARLIERILKPLEGIHKISIIVASKTVIVVHDNLFISQLQILKALNQAKLEATIRAYGGGTGAGNIVRQWPSPYTLLCGFLLLVSLFKHFFRPLQWLAVAAAVVGLPPIVMRSISSLRQLTLDINILMLVAVGGAIGMGDYTEAGFIVFLFTIAEWLESVASHKATEGMSALMSMAPQKAVLAETGQVVDAQEVKVGTVLAVKAGEVIPIDGVVVEGRSEVDEKSLTGESVPVPKQTDSPAWAGTVNIDGYISVKTTAMAENSAVAKMARLVEDAQNSRSKTERLIDSCAKYYTPAVVIVAAGVAVVPVIVGVHNRKHWFQLSLVLIVSACPCALVLSTPVATFCALLKAARNGLLIKGGSVLEDLAKVRVVAFDKTGTITRGEFSILEFQLISSNVTMKELVYWVASIESKSSHPMASALVDYARSNTVEPKPDSVTEFRIYPGEGIHGEIDGRNIYIGNQRIATRAGCPTVPTIGGITEGVTVGYVFLGAIPVGIFTLSDTCRTGVAEAIKDLKSLGVKTAMLTGDSTAAATHAQNQLGHAIEILHAELLPEDKVWIVKDLKAKEGQIAMVGDGMNDAPALAMADVGISMGISGSAVATETSHITLMSNDIRKIPKAIKLARKTRGTVTLNILFSVVTKIAVAALAFAGHPLLWAAVLADVGTCLLVILNSTLLLRTKTPEKKKFCDSALKKHEQRSNCADQCAKDLYGSKCPCSQSKSASSLQEIGGVNSNCSSACKEDCPKILPAQSRFCQSKSSLQEIGRVNSNCSSACKKEDCPKISPAQSHCCQPKSSRSMQEIERVNNNCSSACKKEDCPKISPAQSRCCAEAIRDATGTSCCADSLGDAAVMSQEHEILISCQEEHCSDDSHEEHPGVNSNCSKTCSQGDCHQESPNPSRCCTDSVRQVTPRSHEHLISIGCQEEHCNNDISCGIEHEKETSPCCQKECGRRENCLPLQVHVDNTQVGGCCRKDSEDSGRAKNCSASQVCNYQRESGGCCRSYHMECRTKEGRCGGSMLQLFRLPW